MDNNRSPMDSQQPQLTSTEYSQPQPSTTDDMAGTINNYIHPGATQHFYHSCHVTLQLALKEEVPIDSIK